MWDLPSPFLPRACLYYFRSAVLLFWQLSVFSVKSEKAEPGRVSRVPASVVFSCSSLSYPHPGLSTSSLLIGGKNDELKNQSYSLLSNISMNLQIGTYGCAWLSLPSWIQPSFLSLMIWPLLPCFSSAPTSSLPANSSCTISPSSQTLYLLQSLAEVSVAMTPFLLMNPGLWGSLSFEPTLYSTPCMGSHVITALT